ncbi:MAG: GNAT family N-acetyltransferase [Planctomycetota bacterium]
MIRPATPDDFDAIAALIRGLAEYEKAAGDCVFDDAELRENLFGERPYAEVLIADVDGEAVGLALFFHNFSTWLGKPGVWLEELYVKPEHRGAGYGKALLTAVAQVAAERACGRLEWAVLDWNTPSIEFYKAQGAVPMDEWTTMRVDGEALTRLASRV